MEERRKKEWKNEGKEMKKDERKKGRECKSAIECKLFLFNVFLVFLSSHDFFGTAVVVTLPESVMEGRRKGGMEE